MPEHYLIRDFETRSTLDLTKVGTYRYAASEETKILCMGWCVDDGPVNIWHPGDPIPLEFNEAARFKNWYGVAHNAMFEMQIERHIMQPRYGVPVIPVERNICTMAAANAMALPAKLELCAQALKFEERKDREGRRAMLQTTKPRRARKNENEDDTHWYDDDVRLGLVDRYCMMDVEIERQLFFSLHLLSPEEQRLWLLDQKINNTGFHIDRRLVEAAYQITETAFPALNKELIKLTKGAVKTVNEVAQMKEWLAKVCHINTSDLDKETVEILLGSTKSSRARQLLEIRQLGAHASVKKINAFLQRCCADSRLRGEYRFHAAGTGRWCVDADTLIDTPQGTRRIIDLNPGDSVIGGSGHSRKVLAKLYKGRECMYRLEGPDGAFIIATAGHRILTIQGWKRIDDCFEETSEGRFIPRRGCTPISVSALHHGRDWRETWSQLSNSTQGAGSLDKTGRTQKTKNSGVFSQQTWPQESNVWGEDCSGTDFAARLSRSMERQRIYARASAYSYEGVGAASLAEGLGGASYRWQQDKQRFGQFSNRHQKRASTLARATTWSLVRVGERDVWDISVERDESYTAQGLIHHNSSQGAQVHNLKRLPDDFDVDATIKVISKGDYHLAAKAFANPLKVVGTMMRPMINAMPGCELWGADFSGIEARVTAWLANEESKLEVFRKFDRGEGPDPYKVAAAKIFGISDSNDKMLMAVKKEQRQVGKAAELAFGFQGGLGAFRKFTPSTSDDAEVFTDDEIEDIKDKWRKVHPKICDLWFALNDAFWDCMKRPGIEFSINRLLFLRCDRDSFRLPVIWMTLPSGRQLVYPDVKTRRAYALEKRGGRGVYFKDNTQGRWRDVRIYGGLATENCLGANAQILTMEGWKPIDKVQISDLIWDGIDWVKHNGVITRGVRETALLDGVPMTEDHKVLTTHGWIRATQAQGLYRAKVRLPDSIAGRGFDRAETHLGTSLRLREKDTSSEQRIRQSESSFLWMQERRNAWQRQSYTWNEQSSGISCLAFNESPMLATLTSSMGQLWRAGHYGLQTLARKFREFLERYGFDLSTWIRAGSYQQQQGILQSQLPMDHTHPQWTQSSQQQTDQDTLGRDDCYRGGAAFGSWQNDTFLSNTPHATREMVFDILNCGPRHRFVVRGDTEPFIVHNCVQAVARDLLAAAMMQLDKANFKIVSHTHDEVVVEERKGSKRFELFTRIMNSVPDWAEGLPVIAKAWQADRYVK